jgi:hypothetical protein
LDVAINNGIAELTQFFGGSRRSAEPLERRAGNIGIDFAASPPTVGKLSTPSSYG